MRSVRVEAEIEEGEGSVEEGKGKEEPTSKIQWSDFADEEEFEIAGGRFADARDHRGGV